jgi:hypothetical protein
MKNVRNVFKHKLVKTFFCGKDMLCKVEYEFYMTTVTVG